MADNFPMIKVNAQSASIPQIDYMVGLIHHPTLTIHNHQVGYPERRGGEYGGWNTFEAYRCCSSWNQAGLFIDEFNILLGYNHGAPKGSEHRAWQAGKRTTFTGGSKTEAVARVVAYLRYGHDFEAPDFSKLPTDQE